jgi:hypothetical protein
MPRFDMQAKYPSLPKSPPPVLSLESPRVSETSVLESARGFGLKGLRTEGVLRSDPNTISYSEGPIEYLVFRQSGGIRQRDRQQWMRSERDTSFEISDDAAIEAARGVVKQFSFLREAAAGSAMVKRLHVASSQPGGKSFSERITHAAVYFQRSISGIPVEGPGGKMTVYLSPDKKLTGVDLIWRKVSGIYKETESLRTPEEAIQEVAERWTKRGVTSAVINQIRFGYLELGWLENQTLMQPAYVISGVLGGSDSKFRHGAIEAVAASTDFVGELVPLPPPRPKQKPRMIK